MKLTDFAKSTITQRLTLVAGGDECWIEVRSTNSDEFATAKSQFEQAFSKQIIAGKELVSTKIVLGQEITEKSDDYEKLLSVMIASLITEWSFEDDLNLESAAQFLYNNQSVRNQVDEVASTLSRGEAKAKKPQSNQQKVSSDS